MSCKTCKFYDPYDSAVTVEAAGQCKRYPPEVGLLQPEVTDKDWCGEERTRERARAQQSKDDKAKNRKQK